jgi:signal peptidase I
MSTSSSDNGDPGVVVADGHPDRPTPSVSASSGRHAGSAGAAGAHRPGAVRLPQQLDYRLRGLGIEATDHVPIPPLRSDSRQRRRRHGRVLARVTILLATAALAAWLLQAFVVQPFSMPGEAMTPSIQAGDRILVAKSSILAGHIHSGEIVVFRPPKSLACTVAGGRGGDLVLRVIALPGQTIWSAHNSVFVDGQPLRERGWYDPRFGQVGSAPIPSTTLGQDQYFVMGDNRADACDSRVFGPITTSSVVGEGIAVVVRHGHVFLRTF